MNLCVSLSFFLFLDLARIPYGFRVRSIWPPAFQAFLGVLIVRCGRKLFVHDVVHEVLLDAPSTVLAWHGDIAISGEAENYQFELAFDLLCEGFCISQNSDVTSQDPGSGLPFPNHGSCQISSLIIYSK